jgi:hypothetical protein
MPSKKSGVARSRTMVCIRANAKPSSCTARAAAAAGGLIVAAVAVEARKPLRLTGVMDMMKQ